MSGLLGTTVIDVAHISAWAELVGDTPDEARQYFAAEGCTPVLAGDEYVLPVDQFRAGIRTMWQRMRGARGTTHVPVSQAASPAPTRPRRRAPGAAVRPQDRWQSRLDRHRIAVSLVQELISSREFNTIFILAPRVTSASVVSLRSGMSIASVYPSGNGLWCTMHRADPSSQVFRLSEVEQLPRFMSWLLNAPNLETREHLAPDVATMSPA